MIRLRAISAAVAVLLGAALALTGLLLKAGPWWSGYVSEAGVSGQPWAYAYRGGLVLIGLGVGLLGWSFTGLASLLLGVSAVLAATSGAVPCSAHCPLPPYERSTPADVVHGSASILGMVVLAAAMAVLAWTARSAALRGLSWSGVALMVPLGGTLGLIMLFVGRSAAGAQLERILLVIAILWLIAAASVQAWRPDPLGPIRSWSLGPGRPDAADDGEQGLLDVLDGPVRGEDEPVDGDHQPHAEQR
jgi:hypothetical protein